MYYEVIEAKNIDRYKLVLIFENGGKGTVDLFILTKSWVYCAGLMMWTLRQKHLQRGNRRTITRIDDTRNSRDQKESSGNIGLIKSQRKI